MKLHEIVKTTNDIIADSNECFFGIILEDGYPHVSTRTFCTPANILTSYISTNTSGNLAKSISKNPKASICVSKDNDNITMIGNAKIVDDIKIKKKMWQDWFINHYPDGVNDREYCVIEFKTERLSLWINRQIIKTTIAEIITIQSMCGLMCNTCDFAEKENCKGCIAAAGNPFWGECSVAKCCKIKGYNTCGECSDFPCSLLEEFSCGDSEHCDNPKGARIEILRLLNHEI